MPDYKIINVRPAAKKDYDKAHIDYQSKTGKKIDGLNFFETMVKKFREVVLNGIDKKDI